MVKKKREKTGLFKCKTIAVLSYTHDHTWSLLVDHWLGDRKSKEREDPKSQSLLPALLAAKETYFVFFLQIQTSKFLNSFIFGNRVSFCHFYLSQMNSSRWRTRLASLRRVKWKKKKKKKNCCRQFSICQTIYLLCFTLGLKKKISLPFSNVLNFNLFYFFFGFIEIGECVLLLFVTSLRLGNVCYRPYIPLGNCVNDIKSW